MDRISLRARAIALLPLAALGVHQLRYRLAFGDEAGHELAAQGHTYLASLTPLLALAAAAGAAELLVRLARAWRGGDGGPRPVPFARLVAATAAALVAIYAGQELLEGLLASGHPGGLIGAFGGGGWWSLPLALAFGAGVAALLRGADAAVALIVRSRSRIRAVVAHPRRQRPPRLRFVPAPSPFASSAPGRAPPLGIAFS